MATRFHPGDRVRYTQDTIARVTTGQAEPYQIAATVVLLAGGPGPLNVLIRTAPTERHPGGALVVAPRKCLVLTGSWRQEQLFG